MGKIGKYSMYIRPFLFALDLLTINVLAHFILTKHLNISYSIGYHFFIAFSWSFVCWSIDFYQIYRHTKVIQIIGRLIKQYIYFLILNFAYIGFFGKFSNTYLVLFYVTASLSLVGIFKFFIYFLLRKYNVTFDGNLRKVVILGNGKASEQLIKFFKEKPDYGYKLEGVFDLKTDKVKQMKECYDFVLEYDIDEIYSSLNDIDGNEVNELIDFADNNLKTLKFIPDNKQPLVRNLVYDYCGYIPVLSLRNIPLHKRSNKIVKRAFDIVFSLSIIIFVLSWLTPILALLIRLESKGNVLFKQKRNGLNNKEFICYKFRSMKSVNTSDKMCVTKENDPRVTRIGAFIRKTSIDELPQFWNVFKGDMSVVGPRPLPIVQTENYIQKISKFMVRHLIKPGVTGLAQVSNCRGEVKTDKDIINRLRYDIFYIENWSFVLDIKIIFLTVYNALKGDKKAY